VAPEVGQQETAEHMGGKKMKMLRTLFVGIVAAATLVGPAMAQDGADFFKGKTMTYIVATSPGGGYDTYARLIANHMEKYLPVSKIIVKNVPGAGHIIGANQLYAAKPDGLTIGTFNTGLIYAQLLERDGIQFDLTKMTYLGKAAADPRTIVVSTKSDIKSYDDLVHSAQPVKFAAAGPGSSAYNEIKMLNSALNLNIELITGYRGQEGEMAMMRGEVVGQMASLSSAAPFVKNGLGRLILQIGGTASPELGNAPIAADIITEGQGASIIALIGSQAELARLTAAPPGVPADRAEALVAAYRSALEDPELLEQAKKIGRPIEPLYGTAVADPIIRALDQSPQTLALVTSVLSEKPKGTQVKTALLTVTPDGKKITFNGAGGKAIESKVSGSRTKITIGGKEANRKNLQAGMACDIVYKPGGNNEPISMDCAAGSGKMAAASAEPSTKEVTTALLSVGDGGKKITFDADGKTVKSKVSGKRSKVTIAGKDSKRGDLQAGMDCTIAYTPGGDNEPKSVDCSLAPITVTTALVSVDDGGKKIAFESNGAVVKSKVSGSRTMITISGKNDERKSLKVGMVCAIEYTPGDKNEPKMLDCN
jgi:tripartite-type tricarboxylate transporter receptor subunit TctC